LKANPDVLKQTLTELAKEMKEEVVETVKPEINDFVADVNPSSTTANTYIEDNITSITVTTPVAKGATTIKAKNKKK